MITTAEYVHSTYKGYYGGCQGKVYDEDARPGLEPRQPLPSALIYAQTCNFYDVFRTIHRELR